MKIIQCIPTIAFGDAVGNDAIALKKVIEDMGYETNIYAESVVPPLGKETALAICEIPTLMQEDIAILHLSTGAKLNYDFAEFPCRKIVIYHNITPPHYFEDNDLFIRDINQWAIDGAKHLADKVDYCLADSEYNKQDLIEMGYKCPIDVLPILIPMQDYMKKPDKGILKKYEDDWINIVFTGRIVPNKCQEDVIRAFVDYKRYFNEKSRLFLVGSYKEENHYFQKLHKYVQQLGVKDIVFTNHVSFDAILAYYQLADVFLCMSEHEGFCVPLVEAMLFNTPIIAYDSSAISDTLGGSGILIDTKAPIVVAKMIERIGKDGNLRKQVLQNQSIRLEDFQYDKIRRKFENYIRKFIQETSGK